MQIFLDDTDYRRFVYMLGEVLENHSIDCLGFCLMPNHVHLCLLPRFPNLSAAIQQLNGGYGQWWNRRHQRVGHVFQGRFKDQIADRDEYLLILARYIVLNPVRAGLVSRAEDWPWSSYRATIGLCPAPSFFARKTLLGLFGETDDVVLAERFKRAVEEQLDDPAAIDRIRSHERVLGSKQFKVLIGRGEDPEPATQLIA